MAAGGSAGGSAVTVRFVENLYEVTYIRVRDDEEPRLLKP